MKSEKQPHAMEYAFQSAKRCGAKTRKGTPCKAPALHRKRRCRMHGGAKGSGAPLGNQNALKHGFYSRLYLQEKRDYKACIKKTEDLLHRFNLAKI